MAEQRKAYYWHPRHEWRGLRIVTRDDDGQRMLWNTYVIGWWTVEAMPPQIAERLAKVLDELRRAK